jgi:GLPGLI family protein
MIHGQVSFDLKLIKMKKTILALAVVLSAGLLQAQQNKGMVVYERTSQLQIRFPGMPGGAEELMPKSRTDNFELLFGNNQSLWKAAEQEHDETNEVVGGGDGGGTHIRMVVAGSNDVLFTNFDAGKKVEKRELFDKTFIIDDTISKLKWKMSGETKTILGYPCMKATATNIRKRMSMNMENGKVERKEMEDTANIVAWFTSSIPVAAGPAEYQGQLPGLILEMDVKDGTQVFKAISINEKTDLAAIKEPSGKKRYTAEEFRKERDKMLEEMNRNNQGSGTRIIRMN